MIVKAMGPLAGIKVIDIRAVVPGPYASRIFDDMGADVINVETTVGGTTRYIGPSRTEDMGSCFAMLNRNKRGLAIDSKKPAAMKALPALIDEVDVLIANLARYKQPRSIRFVDALPRNATGKVHKPTSRQLHGGA